MTNYLKQHSLGQLVLNGGEKSVEQGQPDLDLHSLHKKNIAELQKKGLKQSVFVKHE